MSWELSICIHVPTKTWPTKTWPTKTWPY